MDSISSTKHQKIISVKGVILNAIADGR